MRRSVLAAACAAASVAIAACGGVRPLPVVTPAPTPAPTVAPTPVPSALATPASVPVAVTQLEQAVPARTAVPAPVRTPAPTRRPTPAPVPTATPQPPVIIRTTAPASPAHPATVVSDNWSGYVATGSNLWQVSGSWVEPAATCTATTAESVFWVGLGGYPGYPLYQAGSGAFCRNGVPIHALWYELITPSSTQPLVALVQIQPGDSVSASIDLRSGDVRLADSTAGYRTDVAFAPQSTALGSAEWIAEATSHGGTVSTLADFGSVTFSGCSADGGADGLEGLPASSLVELTLDDHSGGTATPGAIIGAAGGGGFSVGYGS